MQIKNFATHYKQSIKIAFGILIKRNVNLSLLKSTVVTILISPNIYQIVIFAQAQIPARLVNTIAL